MHPNHQRRNSPVPALAFLLRVLKKLRVYFSTTLFLHMAPNVPICFSVQVSCNFSGHFFQIGSTIHLRFLKQWTAMPAIIKYNDR